MYVMAPFKAPNASYYLELEAISILVKLNFLYWFVNHTVLLIKS